jgi:hypothetical protein
MLEHLRGQRVSKYMSAGVRRVNSSVGQGALDKRGYSGRIGKTGSGANNHHSRMPAVK